MVRFWPKRNLYGLRVNLFEGHPNCIYRCRLEVDGKVHALVKLVRCVGIIHFVFSCSPTLTE